MTRRQSRLALRGTVSHRPDASSLLSSPGSAVLVRRGVDRSIAIACPDGCGEELTINLDPRTGPAWHYYDDAGAVSLYPSVWRKSGCRSHFIVWRSRIYWCDWHDELERPSQSAITRTLALLEAGYRPYSYVAARMGVVPWEALAACDVLVLEGKAERRLSEQGSEYRRRIER
jgi:hypothetical protein